LTVDAPSGVTVEEIVFPPPKDLNQAGADKPLAVFEQQFAIGVRLSIARSAAPGELTIPAHLRYQACDETLCYAPSSADSAWTIRVVPANAAVTPQHGDVF